MQRYLIPGRLQEDAEGEIILYYDVESELLRLRAIEEAARKVVRSHHWTGANGCTGMPCDSVRELIAALDAGKE